WQVVDTVYFGPALDRMLSTGDFLLVETGPGQTLSSFARRHRSVRSKASEVLSMLPLSRDDLLNDDRSALLAVAARLWSEGHDLDLEAVARLWRPASAVAGIIGQ
ncbi:MAG TPA: hypothetical protein VFZ89_00165, partial [Solirubrobacteraceae bacterium]